VALLSSLRFCNLPAGARSRPGFAFIIPPMQGAPRSASRLDRIPVIAVVIFQSLAALAFLAMPLLAIGYFSTPFLGAFFDNTMVNNGVSPTPVPEHWDLMRQGIGYGDQLIMLDGQPVTNARQMQAILQKHTAGETIPTMLDLPNDCENTESICCAFSTSMSWRQPTIWLSACCVPPSSPARPTAATAPDPALKRMPFCPASWSPVVNMQYLSLITSSSCNALAPTLLLWSQTSRSRPSYLRRSLNAKQVP